MKCDVCKKSCFNITKIWDIEEKLKLCKTCFDLWERGKNDELERIKKNAETKTST